MHALFEDYVELNSFHNLIDDALKKTVATLLKGEGLEKPVQAWINASNRSQSSDSSGYFHSGARKTLTGFSSLTKSPALKTCN